MMDKELCNKLTADRVSRVALDNCQKAISAEFDCCQRSPHPFSHHMMCVQALAGMCNMILLDVGLIGNGEME